jgi:hypothetical protein
MAQIHWKTEWTTVGKLKKISLQLFHFSMIIWNLKKDGNQNSIKFGSEMISYLAVKLQPRYHFSALQNMFFERFPYRNHEMLAEKPTNLTRFLGLAKVNKSNKPKVYLIIIWV